MVKTMGSTISRCIQKLATLIIKCKGQDVTRQRCSSVYSKTIDPMNGGKHGFARRIRNTRVGTDKPVMSPRISKDFCERAEFLSNLFMNPSGSSFLLITTKKEIIILKITKVI